MKKPKSEDYLFYQGERLTVEFYYSRDGRMPARDFFEQKCSLKAQVKLAAYVKAIADEGTLYDIKKFRIVDRNDKIYEFKPDGFRFFTFFMKEGRLIITNGYAKKSQKADPRELARAIGLKSDYCARIQEGTYYE